MQKPLNCLDKLMKFGYNDDVCVYLRPPYHGQFPSPVGIKRKSGYGTSQRKICFYTGSSCGTYRNKPPKTMMKGWLEIMSKKVIDGEQFQKMMASAANSLDTEKTEINIPDHQLHPAGVHRRLRHTGLQSISGGIQGLRRP